MQGFEVKDEKIDENIIEYKIKQLFETNEKLSDQEKARLRRQISDDDVKGKDDYDEFVGDFDGFVDMIIEYEKSKTMKIEMVQNWLERKRILTII